MTEVEKATLGAPKLRTNCVRYQLINSGRRFSATPNFIASPTSSWFHQNSNAKSVRQSERVAKLGGSSSLDMYASFLEAGRVKK